MFKLKEIFCLLSVLHVHDGKSQLRYSVSKLFGNNIAMTAALCTIKVINYHRRVGCLIQVLHAHLSAITFYLFVTLLGAQLVNSL